MIQGDTARGSHSGVAAVLSFVFSGLGQLYNGQIFKGLLIIFFCVISILVLLIGSILIGLWLLGKVFSLKVLLFGGLLSVVGLIASCIIAIFSIVDAYRTAAKQ